MDIDPSDFSPLAVTMGEPAGIGPEIILKSWLARNVAGLKPFFAIGDPDYFVYLARHFNLDIPVAECDPNSAKGHFENSLPVYPVGGKVHAEPGVITPEDSALVSGAIVKAVDFVLSKQASAVVTAPINKKALYDSGFAYPGHTEFLAGLAEQHTGKPATAVMLIAGPHLRTIPVTIHIPLADVPKQLTTLKIVNTATIAAHDLTLRFGISNPRIAVSGLNPHAGESGSMGSEDINIIQPAIEILRKAGISVVGPMPADTMFHAGARSKYDVAICMYHDQALIPAKTLSFDDGVNVTLGLPFIRTSPDHGTAFDIAQKGIANPSSMIAALKMAGEMVSHSAGIPSESAG